MSKIKSTDDIKDVVPRDTTAKYFGAEPKFTVQPDPEKQEWALATAFNWYNYFYDYKTAKDFLVDYLTHKGTPEQVKLMRKVPDSVVRPTTGWLARSILRGFVPSEKHQDHLTREFDRMFGLIKKEEQPVEEEVVNKVNVQEIMRERLLEAGGELEGYFDDFMRAGAKKDFNLQVMAELTKRNILPQHVPLLLKPWQDRLNEYTEVLGGKDDQLNEAYSHLTKHQVKNIINYVEHVLSELNSYISVKKAGRKPRAKKAVSPEKRVAKLKHLKTFKDAALGLDLVSINPIKLLDASEAWVYDTKRRKLHHYVADDYSRVFGVKGNLLLGFSTKESEIKALRKPNEQLKQIMGSKPAARKFFKDIKAKSSTPKGKFNKDMVILKAF